VDEPVILAGRDPPSMNGAIPALMVLKASRRSSASYVDAAARLVEGVTAGTDISRSADDLQDRKDVS
jgi:hypothetical protein